MKRFFDAARRQVPQPLVSNAAEALQRFEAMVSTTPATAGRSTR